MHDPNYLDATAQSLLTSVGGEPLTGSGFENEIPEPGFGAAVTSEED
jgi:hypothetical protein